MNEQEKSLALAELMGWERKDNARGLHKTTASPWVSLWNDGCCDREGPLCPYDKNWIGLAQFAAILLKFPEVMRRFCWIESTECGYTCSAELMFPSAASPDYPTQSNILDEVLRMNGIDPDGKA